MWVLVLIIIASVLLGSAWAYHNYLQINAIAIGNNGSNYSIEDELHGINPSTSLGVVEIGNIIHEGAVEFIVSEYKICVIFIGIISFIVWLCVDSASSPFTTFAFILGAFTSMTCGAFGMHIATISNFRTTICAKLSLGYAFKTAYRAGVVIGFALVSTSLLVLFGLITLYKSFLNLDQHSSKHDYYEYLF